MIAAFVESWPLFQDMYVAAMLVAVLLSLVGIAVVVRDQVFLGAAVSQASLLGIAAGIWLDGVVAGTAWAFLAGDTMHSLAGGLFAVVASLAVAALASGPRQSREAWTGWLFLFGASASVLVVAGSPHGMAEVTRLLSSTLIGANAVDDAVFAVLLAATAWVVATRRRPLLLMLTDAEMARASGLPVAAWDRLLAAWLGLTVAWAIHVSGLVYAFGCLVLPGLVAKNLVREARSLFVAAPLVAFGASLVSLVLANGYDLPPGQVTVALLCVVQVATWPLRR